MREISANLKNLFLTKKTPDFENWSRIFFRLKFFKDFRKIAIFFSPEVYFYEKKKNQWNFFGSSLSHSLTHSLITTASRWLLGEGRRS